MTIYFTSDLHLHHKKVAALRGYEFGVDARHDMNELLRYDRRIVNIINATVGDNDTLFVLGDISSGASEQIRIASAMLNRRHIRNMYLILGNHEIDSFGPGPLARPKDKAYRILSETFGTIAPNMTLNLDVNGKPYNIVLSHYPYREAMDGCEIEGCSSNATSPTLAKYAVPRPTYETGTTILMHGHTHSKTPFEPELAEMGLHVNVGWDAWSRPVSLEKLIETVEEHNR